MKRLLPILAALLLGGAILAPGANAAGFGFSEIDVIFENEDGTPAIQAGSHPFSATTRTFFNTRPAGDPSEVPAEDTKDIFAELPTGLIGKPSAVPTCSSEDFLVETCPASTQLGVSDSYISAPGFVNHVPVYSLTAPPGVPARFGLTVLGVVPVTVDIGVSEAPPYNILGRVSNILNIVPFYGAELTLWGVPGDPAHDEERRGPGCKSGCSTNLAEVPFFTLPRACEGPLTTTFEADSWTNPGVFDVETAITHDFSNPAKPQGFTGCGQLDFGPEIESLATADSAETGTGLDFNVDFTDEGLTNPDGYAATEAKKVEVTFPEGVTINPSVGEGLATCTPAELAREKLHSDPGAGCPNSSKVGTLLADVPIVDEPLTGSIFLAQQDDPATTIPGAENPYDTLIAAYFVLRNTNLGAIVKLPVLVEPDPVTGQLVITLEDIPQYPIAHFNAHLREGQRAPLVTPSACGTYTTKAVFTPWADPANPRTTTASFQITRGIGGGPCPPGGVPPFKPDFEAGSVNNNAGSFSPFNMRLLRNDGEQDMTKFSSILPPGELGSLVGVSKCPDAAVAAARSKTGRQELASPSCPANSLIGHTLAGAGVGGALTYVGGQIYLGGPYKGDPLSVIAVTPAVAGPYDAGTVVVRLALNLNPKTAEVEVDGANSDPIPHILQGIVLKVRDLRVYVDRPNFTLNPTSCDESSARATLFGSYLNVFDSADDVPVDLSTRFQAANCLNLGFKPKLNLNLKGGTRRGGNPGLSAIYTPRKGDANVEGLVVRLPRSAFLDQAHIRTICTRVQFASDTCPKAAQYGYIRAWTPLLDEPLQGPVWLRSSSHKLPDLVFDLHGLVDVEVVTRIDSAKGGIRATVEDAPDAPLSKVVLRMQGGKKGLIVNSRNLCAHPSRANVEYSGHNGKQSSANPQMRPQCGGKGKRR